MYSEDLAIGDIDAIIITHAHNDHYMDLDPILTLEFQYNKLSKSYTNIKDKNYEEAINQLAELLRIYPHSFAYDAFLYCSQKLAITTETGLPETEVLERTRRFEAQFEKDIVPAINKGIYNPKRLGYSSAKAQKQR
jgi:ribonuclease BN (tRNA processing enzyme)